MSRSLITLTLILLLSPTIYADSFWFGQQYMTPLRIEVEQVTIQSETKKKSLIKDQIRSQLHYTIGQLNEALAAPLIGLSLITKITEIKKLSSGYFEVTYDASFMVGWSKNEPMPSEVNFFLPNRGDEFGNLVFYNHYVSDCGLPYEEGPPTFFFYFRPKMEGCSLLKNPDPQYVSEYRFTFAPLKLGESPRFPNYKALIRDDTLKVATLFSESEEGFPTGGELFYELLIQNYGEPSSINKIQNETYVFTHAKFNVDSQIVDVSIFDITQGHILEVDQAFLNLLKKRVREAKLVAYNGHAGYGKKIRAFVDKIGLKKKDRKIIYLNGCDTLSYVFPKHLRKFPNIDFITTGLSGFFSFMPNYTLELIKGLLTRSESYDELLERIEVGVPVILGKKERREISLLP